MTAQASTEKRVHTENGYTYTTTEVVVKGRLFSIMKVEGPTRSYVTVTDQAAFKRRSSIGKDFANFDEAVKSYKSPEMKVALLKAELNF